MNRSNNKGLTLIELILAMAISTIVIGAVIAFMSAGSRSYRFEENEISLQMEAQTVMNQINNLVIEGNNIEFNGTDRLTIYHTDNDSTTYDKSEVIWFDVSQNRLYLYLINSDVESIAMNNEIATQSGLEDNLLGEYVVDFSATLGELPAALTPAPTSFEYRRQDASGATITVTLQMETQNKTYLAQQDIKLRNRVVNIP